MVAATSRRATVLSTVAPAAAAIHAEAPAKPAAPTKDQELLTDILEQLKKKLYYKVQLVRFFDRLYCLDFMLKISK